MNQEVDTLEAHSPDPWANADLETQVSSRAIDVAEVPAETERYRNVSVLGRGGMGEVLLVEDRRIGRLVAKKMIPEDVVAASTARSRFVREARVQGQLEHSSVVPVYDFGWDERGAEFFTMKRVTGMTLRQIMNGLASNEPELVRRFTRHRLLAIFQQICLAIDYAHERGVVHRDLKPTNVMIGDFGEVYVLDWGIAKVGAHAEANTASVIADSPPDDATRADDVLGTPGYMAPEQIRSPSEVDARADVYSLGAMLYLILARQPLIVRGANALNVIEGGLFDPRPSARSLDPEPPPPELDEVCARALALDPDDRYPSARALHDAIDSFLAGRRDLELRAKLADRYTALAVESLRAPGVTPEKTRGEAMRQAAHALALDPTHQAAANLMTRLLLEPPSAVPPEAEATLAKDNRAVIVRNATIAAALLFSFLLGIPMLRDGGMTGLFGYLVMFGPLVVAAALCATLTFIPSKWFALQLAFISTCLAITFASASGLYGSFLLTPVFAQAMISVACSVPALGRIRAYMAGIGVASFVGPIALEWSGLVPRFYSFEGGRMIVNPGFVSLLELPVRTGLTCATIGAILIAATICWRASSDLASQQRDLHVLAWHLRQLVPDSVRKPTRAGDSV